MDNGQLVPDELIAGMVTDRLNDPETGEGFLLDGFPRTLPQAELLDQYLRNQDKVLDAVLEIQVPDEVLYYRLLKRGRSDDRVETVRERIRSYKSQTQPVVDYYEQQQLLYAVCGAGSIDEVTERINRIVEELPKQTQ